MGNYTKKETFLNDYDIDVGLFIVSMHNDGGIEESSWEALEHDIRKHYLELCYEEDGFVEPDVMMQEIGRRLVSQGFRILGWHHKDLESINE